MAWATYKNEGDLAALQETMANLKDRNWAITPESVKLELLALASASSHEAYMNAIKDYDEKICLAISGAFLQMLTANSGKGEMRGNSQSQKSTAELFIWHGAAVVGALIDQSMTPELVRENFAGADFPTVKFGGVNDADLVQSLQVDEGLQRIGYTQDVRDLNSRYARKLKEAPPPDMGGGMGGPPGQNDQGPYDAPNGNLIGGDDRQFAEGPTMPHKNGWWKDQAGRWYLWQDGRRIDGHRNRANPDQVRRANRKPDPRRKATRQYPGQNQGDPKDPGQKPQEQQREPVAKSNPQRQPGSDKPQAANPDAQTITPEKTAEALARSDYRTMGVRAPRFKAWFGDWEDPKSRAKGIVSKVIDWLTGRPKKTYGVKPSVVTDSEGKPLVVYHGTPNAGEFEAFDHKKKGSSEDVFSSYMGPGFYFTESKEVADDYTEKGGKKGANPHRFEVYLNIKNPFDADAWAANLVGNPGLTKLPYQMMADHFGSQEKATEYLKSQGFDGITHLGGRLGDAQKHRVWIAFEPNQVKAVNNRGTFDANDGRMKFSEGVPLSGWHQDRAGRWYFWKNGRRVKGNRKRPGKVEEDKGKVLEKISQAYASGSKKSATQIARMLLELPAEEIRKVKKEFGLRAGGNKVKMSEKIAAQITKRISQREQWNRDARKEGVTPKAMRAMARDLRGMENEIIDAQNGAIKYAKEIHANENGGERLTPRHEIFNGGDYTKLRGFDITADSVAREFTQIFNDPDYDNPDSSVKSDERMQKLFDLLSAGKQKRMSYEESYRKALDYFRDTGHHSERGDEVPF